VCDGNGGLLAPPSAGDAVEPGPASLSQFSPSSLPRISSCNE
jgi:hypothetical protein